MRLGSLSPAERLVRFEPGTLRFLSQRLNPLDHSPLLPIIYQENRFLSKFPYETSINNTFLYAFQNLR